MCGIAAVLDTSDAVLYICGRYSNGWQISSEERLTVLQVWKLKGIFEFDWELMPVMCRSWPSSRCIGTVLRFANQDTHHIQLPEQSRGCAEVYPR